jgi:hypothetical protein
MGGGTTTGRGPGWSVAGWCSWGNSSSASLSTGKQPNVGAGHVTTERKGSPALADPAVLGIRHTGD